MNLGLRWQNAEALLQVPALQKVTTSKPLPAKLVTDLKARGVEVEPS